MKNKLRNLLCFGLILFLQLNVFALKVPELEGAVNDKAFIIDSSDKRELETFLETLSSSTGNQIAVLTVNSLEGESIEEFGIDVADKWKLGQAGKDNGVLLIISMAEKKIRIETGYGLEGTLTDEKCGIIIRNVIAPQFQEGDYSEGIVKGVKAISSVIAPDFSGNDSDFDIEEIETSGQGTVAQRLVVFLFFMLYLFLFTGAASARHRSLSWLPWAFLFHSSGSHYGSGHYHSGSSWSSGGSGFGGSGGGFSGGGGGFGGGGASGGW